MPGRVGARVWYGVSGIAMADQGTICEGWVTTMSVAPAAFSVGTTWGSSLRNTAARTAHPLFPWSGDTVAWSGTSG